MKSNNIISTMLAAWILLTGCSDDFLNRPPQDRLVDVNFYKTDAQILAGVAPLYSSSWKSYIDKANFKLGDIRGGTVFRAYNDRDAVEFNITEVSEPNEQAYKAFFVVIGQANMAIHNINTYADPLVTEQIKNHAIAEARFMRATAYTHLVMNYGAVPLIEKNLDHLFNPNLRRNTVESVWEFIKRDYEFAAANLLEESIQPGRLTKWSAEGMLARTHLTLAGLNASPGSRNQEHLDKAKEYAERVITMSGKNLLENYADLFTYPYDNNEESLFELQWVFSTDPDNGYEASNTMVSQITHSNDIAANGDGWGGDLSASWWMLRQYEGLVSDSVISNDPALVKREGERPGFTLDQRLKATFMLPGFKYPEITMLVEDEPEPYVFPEADAGAEVTFASIKKYVVGGGRDVDGLADKQRYPNNTYMLRLAEMYLIYAEAALGNNASTNDSKAIEYFNKVHMRAGLPAFDDPTTASVNDPIDWDDIFSERIKEFAMESIAWYDLVRLSYYDANKAYGIINDQYRGLFEIRPNQWPNPTAWTFTKTSWATFKKATAGSFNFQLKIPASEASQAPSLALEPVAYEFKE